MHLSVESIQSHLLLFVTKTYNSISLVNRFKWVADNFTIPEDLSIPKIPTVGTRVSVDRTVIVTEKTESNDNSHLKTE